jgi:hypothetical protein
MYHVIDIQTGAIRGRYTSRNRATGHADKLDMAYGAVRYIVRCVA